MLDLIEICRADGVLWDYGFVNAGHPVPPVPVRSNCLNREVFQQLLSSATKEIFNLDGSAIEATAAGQAGVSVIR
jgi:hypothetical protein